MPVKTEIIPPPAQSKQLGFPKTLLYNGSKFEGSQKSKGNSYAVEVVLQVCMVNGILYWFLINSFFHLFSFSLSTSLFLACGRREFIFMRLFKNIRTHI